MEDLRGKFDQALKKWEEYYKKNEIHSFPSVFLDCQGYRELASIGEDILPLLYEYIKNNKTEIKSETTDSPLYCFLPFLLWRATDGRFKIEVGGKIVQRLKDSKGKELEMLTVDIEKSFDYAFEWLEKEISKK